MQIRNTSDAHLRNLSQLCHLHVEAHDSSYFKFGEDFVPCGSEHMFKKQSALYEINSQLLAVLGMRTLGDKSKYAFKVVEQSLALNGVAFAEEVLCLRCIT
jgi:hypothetical protein